MRIRFWIKGDRISRTVSTDNGEVKYFHDVPQATHFIINKLVPLLNHWYNGCSYEIANKEVVYKDGNFVMDYEFISDYVFEILDDLSENMYDNKSNKWQWEGIYNNVFQK